jgi:sugar transferase (PEP-CTERM/EpsH1 system associated)
VNTRADILFVTHRLPFPPDKGDRIRTYHLLRFLSEFANVHLAALADESPAREARPTLDALCARVEIVRLRRFHKLRGLRSLPLGGSISEGAFRSRKLAEVIKKWAAETRFAGAIASASSVAHYLKSPKLDQARRVVDIVDVDSQKWLDYAAFSRPPMSWIYAVEGRRLRKLERRICQWASSVTLVSEGEAAMLRELTGAGNIHPVTNGVDLNYYSPAAPGAESGCVFVGALDYFPNIEGISWFARVVWPNVRLKHPEARLTIVGRRPVAAVRDLRSIPGVDVVGQVPDVRPYVASAAVVVAPLRIARGLQNKVLEAMSMAKPVVASPAAIAGFGHREYLPAWAVNETTEWVTALTWLLDNKAECHRLGQLGRSFAETYHNWSDCLAPFVDLLGIAQPIASEEVAWRGPVRS